WQVFKTALLDISLYSETGKILDLFSPVSMGMYVVMLVVFFKTKLHPVILVLLGAITGIILL
ncbi:MAG TPA: chromate transporter, partial [Treponemataceae bacterium]|nr:chromate transporter [Treponemataceae bacterium]